MCDTVLYIIVPCYNEQEVLDDSAAKLKKFLEGLIINEAVSTKSRILFVDDGSKDDTWSIIDRLTDTSTLFEGLKLAHNAGHQNALWAGMDTVKDRCDCVVTIDADLQDDLNAINGFLKEFENGAQIAYGVRSKRDKDSFFKRFTAEGFYKLMNALGTETVFNHADYRLMSRKAVYTLMEFPEVNLFLRGMVPSLGFKTASVEYERGIRLAGESKYPLKKMLAFAFQGITSFSSKPIHIVLFSGLGITALSALAAFIRLIALIFGAGGSSIAWLTLSVWFLGGLILAALGLIGEYVGKIYSEVKRRPRYITEKYKSGDNQ